MQNIAIKTVKVTDYRVEIPGVGYELLSGFGLARVDTGELYAPDGVRPYLNLRRVCKSLEADGLLPGASFVPAQ